MGDIKCPNCGEICNPEEEICPSCGFNIKEEKNKSNDIDKEPRWVSNYRRTGKKATWFCLAIALITFIGFVISLVLLIVDREEFVFGDYSFTEARPKYIISMGACACAALFFLVLGVTAGTASVYVNQVEGYYVVIYCTGRYWAMVIDNSDSDTFFVPRYDFTYQFKLSGNLPNNKKIIANIDYKSTNIITFDVIDELNKETV